MAQFIFHYNIFVFKYLIIPTNYYYFTENCIFKKKKKKLYSLLNFNTIECLF